MFLRILLSSVVGRQMVQHNVGAKVSPGGGVYGPLVFHCIHLPHPLTPWPFLPPRPPSLPLFGTPPNPLLPPLPGHGPVDRAERHQRLRQDPQRQTDRRVPRPLHRAPEGPGRAAIMDGNGDGVGNDHSLSACAIIPLCYFATWKFG